MIERPPREASTRRHRLPEAPLAGNQRVGARDLQLVNAVPHPARDLDDVEQVEFGELM
jgi:hypothetical protein